MKSATFPKLSQKSKMSFTNQTEHNLWSQVFNDYRSSLNCFSSGSVLILGDDENALFEKRPKTGDGALQYQRIANDNEFVPSSSMNVWKMSDPSLHSNLLKFALTAENFERSVVLFCASMAEPWNLIETLENYGKLLESHLNSSKIDPNLMKSCQKRELKFWTEYGWTNQTKCVSRCLDRSVLTNNLGIPIIVVITRVFSCDVTPNLENEYLYDQEHFDFIQENLRWFCLKYGATLAYLNGKEENSNKEMLLNYLRHRLVGNSFAEYVCFTEKNAVFIPGGWDNEKKIEILSENYKTIESLDDFNEHIRSPNEAKTLIDDAAVLSEDDQEFLSRISNLLTSQVSPLPKTEKPAPVPMLLKPILSPMSKISENAKCTLAAASCANQESVLTTYFNKLITDKSKSISKSTRIAEKVSENRDSSTIDAQIEYLLNDVKSNSNSYDPATKRKEIFLHSSPKNRRKS